MKKFNVFVVCADGELKVSKCGVEDFNTFGEAYMVAQDQIAVFESDNSKGVVYVADTEGYPVWLWEG